MNGFDCDSTVECDYDTIGIATDGVTCPLIAKNETKTSGSFDVEPLCPLLPPRNTDGHSPENADSSHDPLVRNQSELGTSSRAGFDASICFFSLSADQYESRMKVGMRYCYCSFNNKTASTWHFTYLIFIVKCG